MAFFVTVVVSFIAGWAVGAIFGFGAGPAWRRYKKRIIKEYEAEKAEQKK
jgi:hypothetical protein